MSLSSTQLKLAETLASIFISKIDRDQPFIHARIQEWVAAMPKPKPVKTGTSDSTTFAKLSSLNDKMAEIDSFNSIYGRIWPSHTVKQFRAYLDQFLELVERPGIEKSITNLYYFNSAILDRSTGNYASAIENIRRSSQILQDYINQSDEKLPRYSRNIILNLGHESDFFRRTGDYERSITLSDEMLGLATNFSADPENAKFEKQNEFCPIISWAYYQSCEAHLAHADWNSNSAEIAREYTFNAAFSQRHFEYWTPPTLIQILNNEIWGERYPVYTDKIADQLYKGTAPSALVRFLRVISVALGRVRVRMAPVSALGAIVLLLYAGAPRLLSAEEAPIVPSERPAIIQMVDNSLEEARSMAQAEILAGDIDVVKQEIVSSVDELLALSRPLTAATERLSSNALGEDSFVLAAPINGNEHGIGPGTYMI